MNTCILTIGDELLQGFTIDTNSAWIGKTILPYGLNITKKVSVGDNLKTIIDESLKILECDFDFFFVTGGLGPTHDDITKEAFRQILNDELYLDENYYSELKLRFEKHLKKMPEINRSQAMLLKKADIIPNESGSALGMHFYEKETHIFILPGVPDEMKSMVTNHIIPNYFVDTPRVNHTTIKTAGVMESRLAEKVSDLMEKYSDKFRFAFLPHYTGVSFRITHLSEGSNLIHVKDEFYRAMQPYAFGYEKDTLEGILANKLIKNKLTISVAESCTGGLIGKRLTDVPGSSEYFLGSITAYSNNLKKTFLDVPEKTLDQHGAVSEETALAMAQGIKDRVGTNIGLSTTGISGPGGGSKTKSVGLVYISIITPKKSIVKKYQFQIERHIHREMTATAALNITRLAIES